jgi:hypothetical protein
MMKLHMAEESFVSTAKKPTNNTLWIVLSIVLVVVLGLAGGVWWYGNSLLEGDDRSVVVTTPPPTMQDEPVMTPTPTPTPEPVPAEINVVSESKSVIFPKAGRVYIYYLFINGSAGTRPYVIDLVTTKANISVQTPGGMPIAPKLMHVIDTGLDVIAGEVVAIQPYDFGDYSKPSLGWIKPRDGNKCGAPPFGINDLTQEFGWVRGELTRLGEPVVAEQCWADWGGPEDQDYNDFLIVLSYGSPGLVETTTTDLTSQNATTTPTPTPTQTTALTQTQTTTLADETEDDEEFTPRVSMPDTSDGIPVTGVIEDTLKALGIGFGLLLLGLLLL